MPKKRSSNGATMCTHTRKRPGLRTLERTDLEELVAALRGQGLEGKQAIAWLETHGKEVFPRNTRRRLMKILTDQSQRRLPHFYETFLDLT